MSAPNLRSSQQFAGEMVPLGRGGADPIGHEPALRPKFEAPLYVAWEVTLLCNARCLHCYSGSGPGLHDPLELASSDALRIIDDLADAGVLILAFSGGEPLVRKDIFDLIQRAVSRSLIVNIATNGALMTDDVARRLKTAGVRSVTVSLDGASAETHDYMRQFPGLFPRTLRAIETLVRHEHRVVVSFTPTRHNYHEGRAVVKLARDLGAKAVNMSEYVPAGRGTRDLSLAPDVLRQVVLEWVAMRQEFAGRIQIIWHDCRVATIVPPEERDLYFGCGAGRLTARIRVDGTLTPCVFLPNAAGDLKHDSFRDVWEHSPLLRLIRDRDALRSDNCGGCQYKHVCGGCRAVSMSYYGDPMRGDPTCWLVPLAQGAPDTASPAARTEQGAT